MGRSSQVIRSRSQFEHCSIQSPQHIKDVQRAAEQKNELERSGCKINVELHFGPQSKRTFGTLSKGFDWTREVGKVIFQVFKKAGKKEARARKSRTATMACKKAKSKSRTVTRKVDNPLQISRGTFPPWYMDLLADECKKGRTAAVDNILYDWFIEDNIRFERLSGCPVLLASLHLDTNNFHKDRIYSRYSENGTIIVRNGLGMAGYWSVGADRLRRINANAEGNDKRLDENLARFAERQAKLVQKPSKSDAVPFDIRLAREMDEWLDGYLQERGYDVTRVKADYAKQAKERQVRQLEEKARAMQKGLEAIDKLVKELNNPEVSDAECETEKNEAIGAVNADINNPPDQSENKADDIEIK
jgi:hypothetical protein